MTDAKQALVSALLGFAVLSAAAVAAAPAAAAPLGTTPITPSSDKCGLERGAATTVPCGAALRDEFLRSQGA